MNPPVARLVDPLALLASARHPDPFSVLGPHVEARGLVIRTHQPAGSRVDVLHDGTVLRLSRSYKDALYHALDARE